MVTFLWLVIIVLEVKPRALHMLHKSFATEPRPPPSPTIASSANRYLGQMSESADKLRVYGHVQSEFPK